MKTRPSRLLQAMIVGTTLVGITAEGTASADEGVARVSAEVETLQTADTGAARVSDVGHETPAAIEPASAEHLPPAPPPTIVYGHSQHGFAGGPSGSAQVDVDNGRTLGIGKRVGSYGGVKNGDTVIQGIVPLFMDPGHNVLSADIQGLITDNAKGGATLGLTYGAYSHDINRVFKFASWWTLDDGHQETYRQVGFGFESLGKWFDMRINGYLPVGDDRNVLSTNFLLDPEYSGNAILLQQQQFIESAYRGVDAEVGGPIPILGRYGVSGYLGGYYWTAKEDESAGGVRVRFDANITEDWTMGVNVSDDRLWGTNVWMNINITLPDGKPSRWFRQRPVKERLYTRHEHNYRVSTHLQEVITDVPAINPADNMPFQVVHFDSGAGAGGDGTFGNPFNDFGDYNALPQGTRDMFDILFVQNGGTFTDGIVLSDNQRLLSQAFASTFVDARFGTFALPGFVAGSDRPTLSHADGMPGDAVILAASNNEIRGFIIDGATNDPGTFVSGIVTAPGAVVSGFNIRDNIFNNTVNGASIVNNSGTAAGIFMDNVLNGNGNNSNKGLLLVNTGGATLNLLVEGNTVQNFLGEDVDGNRILGPGEDRDVNNGVLDTGEGISIVSDGLGSTINAVPTVPGGTDRGILNNTLVANGSGLALRTTNNGVINATVSNNVMNDNVAPYTGFRAEADSGDINLPSFNNNTVSGNAGTGIALVALNAGSIMLPASEDRNNNGTFDFEDANGNGILDAGEDLNGNGMLDTEDGNGNGILDFGFTGNVVTNNGGFGIEVEANSGNIVAHIGSADDSVPDDSVVGVVGVPDNVITGNLGGGIAYRVLASEDVNSNGILDPNEDANRNGRLDLGGGTIVGSIINNSLDNTLTPSLNDNSGDIVFLSADDGDIGLGAITLDAIANNNMSNAGANPLHIQTTNGGTVTIRDTEDANRNGMLDPGEDANGNGVLDRNGISNNDFDNPTQHGILVDADSGGVDLGRVDNNSFRREESGTDGIRITSRNADISGTIVRNVFVGDPVNNPNEDANFDGVFAASEDTNMNGILDAGEDTNANGVLDLNEDLNNNGILDQGTGVGVNLVARGGSVNLSIGEDDPILTEASTYGNLFDNNVDAAIALEIGGGTSFGTDVLPMVSEVHINRNTITNTQFGVPTEDTNNNGMLDAGEDRDGDGILDTEGFYDGDGIHMRISGTQTLLANSTINFNTITDNARNGIQVIRQDDAVIDNFEIRENLINNNGSADSRGLIVGNGIFLNAENRDNDLVDFTVIENEITENALYGIDLLAGADAQLSVDIVRNLISMNGRGGIRTEGQRSIGSTNQIYGSGDAPTVTGTWIGNMITNNTGPGIEILDTTTAFIGDGTEAGRNFITGNRIGGGTDPDSDGDGIYITGAVNNVTINTNTIDGNEGDGIDVDVILNHVLFGSVINNNITNNEGDGIELATLTGINFPQMGTIFNPFLVDGNVIADNRGRGIDMLVRGNSIMNVAIDNNLIASNGEEGVYAVVTSSTTQSQDVPSRDPLAADGTILRSPDLNIRVNNNQILDNGGFNFDAPQSGGGLNTNVGGLVFRIGTSGFGQTTAEITNNVIEGNFGDDVFMESFTSTVDPAAVTGTFPNRDNLTASLEPLARLDIVMWQNNRGDSLQPTNEGAFYDNADQFKSRDNNQNPPGPFQNADRRRNAQRLVGGVGNPLGNGITSGVFDGFEGTGLSTFRIENTFDPTGFDSGFGFITDIIVPAAIAGTPEDFLIPQGVSFRVPPNIQVGEFPFGWDGDSLSPSTVFP